MILSAAEREHKINDFLSRKFKEFDIEAAEPAHSARLSDRKVPKQTS